MNASLPPIGPAWAGALMGTSIAGTLLGIHVNSAAGGAITAIAGLIMLAIMVGWLIDSLRFRSTGVSARLAMNFTVDALPAWSMMTMGVLSLGSATDLTFGWTQAHAVTLVLGAVASTIVIIAQSIRILQGKVPAIFPGVLPLVTPMVAATNCAQMGHPRVALGFFLVSLCTALPAFARVYLGDGRHPTPVVAATAWIPLGVIGQSSTTALLISDPLTGSAVAGQLYATVALSIGIPIVLWAAWVHWGSLLRFPWPPYGPPWWACTFPVGTCSLGTHTLAISRGCTWLDSLSVAFLALLCVHILVTVTYGGVTLLKRPTQG